MKTFFKIMLAVDAVVLAAVFLVVVPLSFGGRSLTEEEIAVAKPIFADSLNLKAVRIKEGGLLTWFYPGVTTGNIISFPTETFDFSDEKDRALLLHELTHVWQYQHDGWGYLPRVFIEEITQSDAYVVHYEESKIFADYDLEEQAEIVAGYYLTKDERYEAYIDKLQSEVEF